MEFKYARFLIYTCLTVHVRTRMCVIKKANKHWKLETKSKRKTKQTESKKQKQTKQNKQQQQQNTGCSY